MKIVRSDKRDTDTFESPRRHGNTSSIGPQDILVQADNYVYASFDQTPHYMARTSQNQREIDPNGIEDRTELVMQDIANLHARYSDGLAKAYLSNTFDLETGKDILAEYLAYVFESPEEAIKFISLNNHPRDTQRWDTLLDEPENERVISKMKELKKELGIEPPLSLEIRIRSFAKRKIIDSSS